MTAKIRAAAQALLDNIYSPRFVAGAYPAAIEALRAALAEPAQPAPDADLERLAWDARQALIDYGRACLGSDAEAVRDSTTRACAAIDALTAAAGRPG